MKHYRWICLLLLAMATTQTLAQEEPGAAETPPAQSEAGSGEVVATPEPEPAVDQAATGNETSPFDYRASEEISEDLSVSFPVDI